MIKTSNRACTGSKSVKNRCKRCGKLCDPYEKPALQCVGNCARKIHLHCLKRKSFPNSFVGDVFFTLTCSDCEPFGNEVLVRDKMSWSQIIVLALYNLREKSSGISKRGYFHWKSDISTFVDRHWDYLFTKQKRQPKQWIGTISGTLSHNTGIYFKSGSSELGETGWWKLISKEPPEIIMHSIIANKMENKTEEHPVHIVKKESVSPIPSESSTSLGDDSSYIGDSLKNSKSLSPPHFSEILSDFLLTEEDLHDMDMLDTEDGIEMDNKHETLSLADLIRNFRNQHCQPDQYKSETYDFDYEDEKTTLDNSDDFVVCDDNKNNPEFEQFPEDSSDSTDFIQPQVQPSLFTTSEQRPWPWEKNYSSIPSGESRSRISEREETYLLQRLKRSNLATAPPSVKRLYRKLSVRKLKREYSLRIFDVDQLGTSHMALGVHNKGSRILDRFVSHSKIGSFEQRLQGINESAAVHSPYTNRLLKPFIRRDTTTRPLWLKLQDELYAKTNENNFNRTIPTKAPIDYSYIRPQHIPALNSLCNQFFWPGIDLSECLQYPDFSCVASYKKLIIGFAIMVPDVAYNQTYISFFLTRPEWRNSGIGTFMLYHLIQTCMGKDVTLHVSVTNPALILYQKFGFKVEEFVQDFYDKYIPPDSRECRHALFLRLCR
ncbi:cysteine-rich protein 2-binding protein isoform X1 [Leptopilina heterotoma]|uniref:cysteine-rich protein 2-binding protein isoform X1 n=1 Tax=Leptopilina heterotoma TaxID=63436 RepID=UPI001CA85477|nr:cysteine-rich protein 2-binding protein isoform X1 [Leptopilina heterotoma]